MIDLDRLWDLVLQFLRENPQWVTDCAEPVCDYASLAFCQFCLLHDVDAVPRWGDLSAVGGPISRSIPRGFHPWLSKLDPSYPVRESRYGDHCVAVVCDRWVVDLTARQYGDELPFPFLWTLHEADRLGSPDDPAVGDRVRARSYINGSAVPGDVGVVLKVFPGRRIGIVDFRPQNLMNSAASTVLFSDGEVEVVERASRGGRRPPPVERPSFNPEHP